MDKEDYIVLAEKLADSLEGKTHIVSRYKVRDENGWYESNGNDYCFYTFHSLVYKVLPMGTEIAEESLTGEIMYSMVNQAATTVLNIEQSDEVVRQYYELIRLYSNNHNIDLLESILFGKEVYAEYQYLMTGNLDWEDSVLVATKYLESSLFQARKVNVDNLIVLYPEVLFEESNSNVIRFFKSFYRNYSHSGVSINLYLLSENRMVYPFIQGNKLPNYSINDITPNQKEG